MKTTPFLLAAIFALSACSTAGQGIKTATVVDAKTNLAGYKTYDWLATAQVLKDPYGEWAPVNFDVDQEVQFLIDQQLRNKRVVRAADAPDAYVMYVLGVNMDTQKEKISQVFGDKADLNNLSAGSLLIALVDAQAEKAIWAGAAVAQTKTERTDEIVRARLAAAIEKIFAQYPN